MVECFDCSNQLDRLTFSTAYNIVSQAAASNSMLIQPILGTVFALVCFSLKKTHILGSHETILYIAEIEVLIYWLSPLKGTLSHSTVILFSIQLYCTPLHCLYTAILNSTPLQRLYSAPLHSALPDTLHYSGLLHTVPHHTTPLYSSVSTLLHSTDHYNALHSTPLHSIQYLCSGPLH